MALTEHDDDAWFRAYARRRAQRATRWMWVRYRMRRMEWMYLEAKAWLGQRLVGLLGAGRDA